MKAKITIEGQVPNRAVTNYKSKEVRVDPRLITQTTFYWDCSGVAYGGYELPFSETVDTVTDCIDIQSLEDNDCEIVEFVIY